MLSLDYLYLLSRLGWESSSGAKSRLSVPVYLDWVGRVAQEQSLDYLYLFI